MDDLIDKLRGIEISVVRANRALLGTTPVTSANELVRAAADRLEAQDALLREAMAALDDARGLLVDAMVQLTDGKIKTRRNRALLIQDFLSRDKEQTND